MYSASVTEPSKVCAGHNPRSTCSNSALLRCGDAIVAPLGGTRATRLSYLLERTLTKNVANQLAPAFLDEFMDQYPDRAQELFRIRIERRPRHGGRRFVDRLYDFRPAESRT